MEFYEFANFSHDSNDEMAPQLQQEFQSSLHLNICHSGTELLKYSNFQFPNNDSNVCLATLSKKCEVNSKTNIPSTACKRKGPWSAEMQPLIS